MKNKKKQASPIVGQKRQMATRKKVILEMSMLEAEILQEALADIGRLTGDISLYDLFKIRAKYAYGTRDSGIVDKVWVSLDGLTSI